MRTVSSVEEAKSRPKRILRKDGQGIAGKGSTPPQPYFPKPAKNLVHTRPAHVCRLASLYQTFDGLDDNKAGGQEEKIESGNSGPSWPLGIPELP